MCNIDNLQQLETPLSTTTSFEFVFWGKKNNGFSVLYHNMKYGLESTKEFEEFLRESCVVEESYIRSQTRLVRFASNCSNRGSFAPFWQVMKIFAEKLSNLHQQLMQSWQDLTREVHKYNTEQQRKHKEVKDQEAPTLETVQCIQQTVTALQRAKDTYHARCFEFEKLKRENASHRDCERAETKMKRARDEYQGLVDKYATVRNDFEKQMTESCKRFQEVEEKHLQQMKDFIETYMKSWKNQYALLGQVHEEFCTSSKALSVDKLIETFVQAKSTGTEKPGAVEFVEPDLAGLLPISPPPDSGDKREGGTVVNERTKRDGGDNLSQGSGSDATVSRPHALKGIALWRRGEKKSKRHSSQNHEKGDGDNSNQNVPQVDEEGYTIRPDNPTQICNHDSSDTSSDSDSDNEDRKKKISIAIRPVGPNRSDSTDNITDIRNVVQGFRLSPTLQRRTPVNDGPMKNTGTSKPSDDLIDFDIFSTDSNIPSTTLDGNTTSPSVNGEKTLSDSTPPSATSAADVGGSTSLDDSISSLSYRHRGRTPTPTALLPVIAAPAVPTRTSRTNLPSTATARPAGRQTPDPFRLEQMDSVTNLNTALYNTSASFGVSRGPSPLTVGLTESIPLAVAFSETVHAYFSGSSPSRCQAKLTGELILSFPAGIIRHLVDSLSLNTLSFRVKNTTNVEQFLANKPLVAEDAAETLADYRDYNFDMTALTDHLRGQIDQNKNASYFNIDILKYQIKSKPGSQSVPLELASVGQCSDQRAEFRLNYSYNESSMFPPAALSNVSVILPVTAPVSAIIQSTPNGTWSAQSKKATWRLGDISGTSETTRQGSLQATFDLSSTGEQKLADVVAVQFLCDGSTVSGVDFEITSAGYRVSLIKKRIVTGKYLSDIEPLESSEVNKV